MPSGCIGASNPRHPVQKPVVIKTTQAWPPPVLGMPRELHPICNIHQGLLSLLALKLFSSSAASSNTQKSGPARFPPLLSLTSPVPPFPYHTHIFSPLLFNPLSQAALHATALAYPICPCVYSACVCMCVFFVCVCQTRLHQLRQAPGVSGWMFPLLRISSPSVVNPSARS
jgi:hypothetical protein